ncbi:MAG: hypothetical protein ABIJ27_04715 [Candidatus Omnitrophota bacterium]
MRAFVIVIVVLFAGFLLFNAGVLLKTPALETTGVALFILAVALFCMKVDRIFGLKGHSYYSTIFAGRMVGMLLVLLDCAYVIKAFLK